MKCVYLKEIIERTDLEIVHPSTDLEDFKLYSSEVSRPGLQIVGYFEKFAPERIQIIGNAEWHYYNELSPSERYDSIESFFRYPIPAFIVARELPIFDELEFLAKKYNRTLLRSADNTSNIINGIVSFIELKLAPEIKLHGVFVEVYGVGVLIRGKSGVGKSETALDLVIRGHRLISDDMVEIKKIEGMLLGESPEITRHFMEVRGLGILDIERLYGVGAVKHEEYIDLVIELETWDENKEYDRIGLDEEFTEILDKEVPTTTVPVRPGRNIAMIIEVAARNFRQRRLGYNAAYALNQRIKEKIRKNMEEKNK
ncbi:MAG TPA: HPr(Ser) kinase/phosphatase [Tissierellaceae bacterium]|nr:HPr(Ser) kinase/phosphatase [Tissierellaceae bacterium]